MSPLRVLIAGADMATLTLALMLEQAGIDYLLLESHDTLPVVAGGVALHPTVLPLLEQLSLRDDLLFFSQPLEQALVFDANMNCISSLDWSSWQTRYGAWSRFISRPEYCSAVLEKIPESRVLFNKTIQSVTTVETEDDITDTTSNGNTWRWRPDSLLDSDSDDGSSIKDEKRYQARSHQSRGVTVECSDGSVYTGHVLVGDVYSQVERKIKVHAPQMQHLDQERDLPQSLQHLRPYAASHDDGKPHWHGKTDRPPQPTMIKKEASAREIQFHVSGITEALDPQRIPLLKEDTTQLRLVTDDKSSFSWWAATLVDRRIAWQVTKRIPLSEKSVHPNEFGTLQEEQVAAAILEQVSSNMVCPLGGTMSQLISWTPSSNISCRRWDDRRTVSSTGATDSSRVVILGEACKKILPVFGQAGVETILDALALGEALFYLPSTRLRDIHQALETYRWERTVRREAALDESRNMDLLLNVKGPTRRLYRSLILNYTPKCMMDKRYDEKYSYRPQASFLDQVPDYGQVLPISQPRVGGVFVGAPKYG
ncbi:hypothetical protein BGW38_003270 [Lunasporangiospora selenospora]|uniref:FAD-binding domain-containing protein n=1 Tax=Lunasporangiospora selenospora TaxID=979761 RepID=A0A9P6FS25_9FUNG|nr:hypothetical protein BGW38_003270 [Lunasporangiospora selenospora]